MSAIYDDFISAIHSKSFLSITFNSGEKGVITRKCVPFDYGVGRRYKDAIERYHFLDIDSPDGSHNLSIKPEQIVTLEILDENFDPADYIKWQPNWIIKRDWGIYS